jgi:hypothetical protein
MQNISMNKNPKESGNITFQPIDINWSYLYLGNVPLTQMKRNNTKFNLKKNINQPGIFIKSNKGNQPPKNNITKKLDINII